MRLKKGQYDFFNVLIIFAILIVGLVIYALYFSTRYNPTVQENNRLICMKDNYDYIGISESRGVINCLDNQGFIHLKKGFCLETSLFGKWCGN